MQERRGEVTSGVAAEWLHRASGESGSPLGGKVPRLCVNSLGGLRRAAAAAAPISGPFCNLGMLMRGFLERWLREIRGSACEALPTVESTCRLYSYRCKGIGGWEQILETGGKLEELKWS